MLHRKKYKKLLAFQKRLQQSEDTTQYRRNVMEGIDGHIVILSGAYTELRKKKIDIQQEDDCDLSFLSEVSSVKPTIYKVLFEENRLSDFKTKDTLSKLLVQLQGKAMIVEDDDSPIYSPNALVVLVGNPSDASAEKLFLESLSKIKQMPTTYRIFILTNPESETLDHTCITNLQKHTLLQKNIFVSKLDGDILTSTGFEHRKEEGEIRGCLINSFRTQLPESKPFIYGTTLDESTRYVRQALVDLVKHDANLVSFKPCKIADSVAMHGKDAGSVYITSDLSPVTQDKSVHNVLDEASFSSLFTAQTSPGSKENQRAGGNEEVAISLVIKEAVGNFIQSVTPKKLAQTKTQRGRTPAEETPESQKLFTACQHAQTNELEFAMAKLIKHEQSLLQGKFDSTAAFTTPGLHDGEDAELKQALKEKIQYVQSLYSIVQQESEKDSQRHIQLFTNLHKWHDAFKTETSQTKFVGQQASLQKKAIANLIKNFNQYFAGVLSQETVKSIRQNIKHTEEQARALFEQIERKNEEIDKIKATKQQAETALTDLQRKHDEANADLKTKQGELKALTEEAQSLPKTTEEITLQKDGVVAEIKAKKAEIRGLEEAQQQVATALADLQQEHKKANADLEAKKTQLSSQQTQVNELSSKLQALKTQETEDDAAVSQNEEKIEALKGQLQTAQQRRKVALHKKYLNRQNATHASTTPLSMLRTMLMSGMSMSAITLSTLSTTGFLKGLPARLPSSLNNLALITLLLMSLSTRDKTEHRVILATSLVLAISAATMSIHLALFSGAAMAILGLGSQVLTLTSTLTIGGVREYMSASKTVQPSHSMLDKQQSIEPSSKPLLPSMFG